MGDKRCKDIIWIWTEGDGSDPLEEKNTELDPTQVSKLFWNFFTRMKNKNTYQELPACVKRSLLPKRKKFFQQLMSKFKTK